MGRRDKGTERNTYAFIGYIKRWWREAEHKSDEKLYINNEEGTYVGKSIGGHLVNINYGWGRGWGLNPAVNNRIENLPTDEEGWQIPDGWEWYLPHSENLLFKTNNLSEQDRQAFFDFLIVVWDQLRRAHEFTEDDTPEMVKSYDSVKGNLEYLHELGYRSTLYDWVFEEEEIYRVDTNWFLNSIKGEKPKSFKSEELSPSTNDLIYVSNRYKRNFYTVHRCINEELNLYCEFHFSYRWGWVVLEENQLENIRIENGWSDEAGTDTYWINKFAPSEGSSAPFFDLRDPNYGQLVHATVRRGMQGGEIKEYDDDALMNLESGGLFKVERLSGNRCYLEWE